VHAPATPATSAAPAQGELGELDRAEAQLDEALRGLTAPRFAAPPPSPAPASALAPESVAEPTKAGRAEDERDASGAVGTADRAQQAATPSAAIGGGPAADRCAIACHALASMARATESLCELRGADDARCLDARARVEGAAARVRSACPACHE
jgi:hypothetical protein